VVVAVVVAGVVAAEAKAVEAFRRPQAAAEALFSGLLLCHLSPILRILYILAE
jgi:hypothetical protein